MNCFKHSIHGIIAAGLALACSQANAETAVNDFPTKTRAEYVFACMSSNGQSQIMLEKCSCSIDTIAKMMNHDEYIEAETVLRMRQLAGDRVALFREAEWANKLVETYRRAQTEAEIRCF